MARARRGIALVKWGGSLLTDKRAVEEFRKPVAARLADELRRARDQGARVVLGHGAGSFGHAAAARHGLGGGPIGPGQLVGAAETQDRAASLHRLVIKELLRAGLPAFSVAPSSVVTLEGGRVRSARLDAVFGALELAMLPVLYGDVAVDRSWGVGVCSTEVALLAVARGLVRRGIPVRSAIWLGDTAGVWDEHGRTIPRIRLRELASAARHAGGSAGTDVTGGMAHRLACAGAFARLGISSVIADGRVPGLLREALLGGQVGGTVVVP